MLKQRSPALLSVNLVCTVCCCLCVLQLQGSKVSVSISYPADINTPGYAKESLSKVGHGGWQHQTAAARETGVAAAAVADMGVVVSSSCFSHSCLYSWVSSYNHITELLLAVLETPVWLSAYITDRPCWWPGVHWLQK